MNLRTFFQNCSSWDRLVLYGDPLLTPLVPLTLQAIDRTIQFKHYRSVTDATQCLPLDLQKSPLLVPIVHADHDELKEVFDDLKNGIFLTTKLISGQHTDRTVQVDCQYPKKMSDRTELLSSMLRHRKVHPGVINYVSEWCRNSEDLSMFVRLINTYVFTRDELEHLYPLRRPSLERLFLNRRIRELLGEFLDDRKTVGFLSRLHNVLTKAYIWIEGCKTSETRTIEILGLETWEISYWKGLDRRYSSRVVREVLEETAEAYKLARLGMLELAKTRMVRALQKLGD